MAKKGVLFNMPWRVLTITWYCRAKLSYWSCSFKKRSIAPTCFFQKHFNKIKENLKNLISTVWHCGSSCDLQPHPASQEGTALSIELSFFLEVPWLCPLVYRLLRGNVYSSIINKNDFFLIKKIADEDVLSLGILNSVLTMFFFFYSSISWNEKSMVLRK